MKTAVSRMSGDSSHGQMTTIRRTSRFSHLIRSAFGFLTVLGLVVGVLLDPGLLAAQTFPPGFVNTTVGGYWPELAGFTFDDLGTMYAWERAGRVWILENDVKRPTPMIDIREEVGAWDDHGLLSVALHPNFRENGYIYLLYALDHHYLTKFGTPAYNPAANEYKRATMGRITRYTARASDGFRSVDPASRTILLGETAGTGCVILNFTHGVGSLVFGQDGTLMVTCGDGAGLSDAGSDPVSYYALGLSTGILAPKENVGAFRSQMIDSLSGKVLRLDPLTGNGVPSNPYYNPANPRAHRSRVWALGLRNPFRMTLRPGTGSHNPADGNPGEFTLGDVGYDTWEETDVVTGPGQNFGWPIFEGLEPADAFSGFNPVNPDAPNPLFGTGGCTQPSFRFRDLIVQATLATPSWPNPCNAGMEIPASTPRFMHARPLMDWRHGSGPSRTGRFSGTTATVINIGAAGSPLMGPQFGGNCSIGGSFYLGTNFPSTYQNSYFFGDLGNGWIKNLTFDANNQPTGVRDFASGLAGVVHMGAHPLTGKLYYVLFYDGLFKVDYVGTGNQPPTAVATANTPYGPSPLAVQFTGSGSSDPEGLPLSYLWNFNDGSPVAQSTAANPSHTFTAPAGVPTRYDVTLRVTDSAGATSTQTLIISPNNSPPTVAITSPTDGTLYPLTGDTTYSLTANVSDAEHANGQLTYEWQTILRHNNHEHLNPVDPNPTTTTVISPIGCDGNIYYYRILLKVTDPAGLFRQEEVQLYPNCAAGNTAPTISDTPHQTIAHDTTTGPIGFTVGDAETEVIHLVMTGASSNPALVPTGNLVFGGSGATRTVTVTPVAGQSGTATITLTVSDGQFSASDAFLLTVTGAANTAPTIANIADLSRSEDTGTGAIGFTVGDAETAAGSLAVTGASSNPALVPNGNLVFGGSGVARTVTVTPAANQSGTATITVTVSDGALTASDTFVLTVTPVNDGPTISNIADQTITQSTATGAISFTVGDAETAAGSLTVTGTSNNAALVPNGNIVFGGSGATRTVTITPAAGQSGTATITVTVSDGALTGSDTLLLTVTSTLPAPTYLLSEGFEGTGFENAGWTVDGTPNPDYTTTALHGAQSLNTSGAQYISRTFQNSTSFHLYTQVRAIAWGSFTNLMYWDDAGWDTAATVWTDGSRLHVTHGTASVIGTTPLSPNTTYHVWVEWTKGTGTNGTMKVFLATTGGTKPAVAEASLTTGTGGATERLYVGPTGAGPNLIFDRLLIDDVAIVNPNGTPNTAPTIADVGDRITDEDAATGAISVTVGDAETPAASLVLTGASSNPALVSNGNIVFGGSGTARTVTITPVANQSGTAIITLTVSDGALTASDPFLLTVTAVNDAPTTSAIADQIVNENTSTGAIAFTVGDPETAAASLVVTASSSNPALVPPANVVFGGSGAARTVTVTPVADQTGTTTMTVTVSDGALTAVDTFLLTVIAVNDPPTISDLADLSTNEDTATSAVSFTVGDAETAAASLVVTGSSSNPALVPSGNVVFGGSGASRTVTVTPAANQSGTTTITVTVSDGTLTSSDTYLLTVTPVNDGPTIADIADRITNEDTSTGAMAFTVGDPETPAASLVMTGSSSNPALVANGSLVFGGSGTARTVTIMPEANQSGTATITVTVDDGGLTAVDTFLLTVTPVNDAPTIADIVNQTIVVNTSTSALSVTIGDLETAAASLVVSGTSSNPTLVPPGNIVFGGSGTARTVTITPAANQSGTATITVTVSDGSLTASDTLVLTVNAVNTAPTISNISDQTITQDTATGAISFTVGDAETAAGSLTVTGTSNNAALVPNGNIVFGGSGATRTVTITPAAGQSGTATITVTVSDGALTGSDTLLLTVTSTLPAPTYLLSEGFEGTGFENAGWTVDGTPNPDYTTTALHGAQSLNTSGAQYISRTFQNSTSFHLYTQVRAIAWGSFTNLMYWDDAGWDTAATVWTDGSRLHVTHGTASVIGTTPLSPNTTYHVWVEWTKGTGTNGTMKVFLATTGGTKPAVAEASLTTGTGGATERLYVGPTGAGPNLIFDRLLIDDVAIVNPNGTPNTAPTIADVGDRITDEDAATGAISVTVGDAETPAASLVLTGASSNPALVPNSNIVFGGSGTARTVTITPVANQSGTAIITLTVSDGALTASDPFLLTVTAVNDAPTTSAIADQIVNENASTGAIAFTVGDPETAAASLVVTASSSNPALLPDGNIVLGGSGAARTVTVSPVAEQSGTAILTVTVSDGTLTSSDTFLLTVTPVNDGPTISDIANQVVNEDTSTGAIAFTVGDPDTAAASLVVTATSSNPALVPDGNIVLGGSGASRTVTVTPVAEQSGTATLTVTVSDGTLTSTDTFLLTVTPVNDAPTLSDLADLSTTEDTATSAVGFTVGDTETAAGSLTVTGTSSNTALVPNSNIVFGGSGASRTVTVTPAASQSGTTTITVTVSDGALTGSDTFLLTVTAVNDGPTISDIANQLVNENTSTGAIAFTVGDPDTAAASLVVTATSSNPALVPDGNIVLGGSGAARTVTVAPVAEQSGTATLTVTVSDGTLTSTDTFLLTVTPVNDAPTLSDLADLSTTEDTATSAVGFTVGDTETAAGSLTVTGTSSNLALVPNSNIVFGGSGASRTVTVTPAANQSGTTTITVTVSDGALTGSDTFLVTVTAVNDGPTIADIANQVVNENTSTGAIAFTVGDPDTAAASLVVTATSSNPALVPDGNIVLGGSGAARTVTVAPVAEQSGTATLTVTVSDGTLTSSDTFLLTVTAVNDGPTIADIANQIVNEDTATSAFGFTVGDTETAAGSLTVTGTSSNLALVPNSNIVFGGSGASRTVTVTPAANQSGTTTITVTVSDGALTGSDTFLVTVTAVNDGPTIADIADRITNEDTSTGAMAFTVGDPETPAASLVVTAASSNPALVPDGNIVLGGSGTSRTVTVTPAANQSGATTITVTVSDGALTASDTFLLTFTPVNDAPTISDVVNQTIVVNTSTSALSVTIGDLETAAASLVMSGTSSNPTLVPPGNVVFGGSGTARTVTITPAAGQSGTATITVIVSDGSLTASDTLVLTVNAVNTAPTISNIADQTITQDTATGAISFTVGDAETATGSLTVTGTSNNAALVPNGNIVFGGSGATRTVTITPAAGQSGTATITVTVSDSALTGSDTLLLTVTATIPAPTYLLSEGFEGTGFESAGWTKNGTPNPDYTTTVLHGAQSLNTLGAQYISRTFQNSTSFYLYTQVRAIAWSGFTNLVYLDDANWGNAASVWSDGTRLHVRHGSVSATGTTPLSPNTTYHVWVEWSKGTGTNGTLKVFVATTGTKPAVADASITTGTGGATQRLYVGPTGAGPNLTFDRLLIDDVAIGSNP